MKNKLGIFVGAVLAIASLLKLLQMWGVFNATSDWVGRVIYTIEPYFAPLLILAIGVLLIVYGIKGYK